ncbi:MAG TPA: ATP-binding cassette domain-containing protein [bacterium]|nr:ATP-binding cassette domain-containing protein [bacterium]
MITVRGIFKKFGSLEVLKGVDLDVHAGETLVVLGQSGGGKSVLLKAIAGLLEPDAGSVLIDGRVRGELRGAEAEKAALQFAYLFQGAALFDSLTVGENVTFALRRFTTKSRAELRDIAEERLLWVGLRGIQDKKPAELSGGMRKRVGLARAIAMDPAYVLYDEPTTGLDPISSDAIADLILSLQARLKCTSIVVTHDMALAFKVGDRLSLLNQGRMHVVAEKEAFRNMQDPAVQQFIHGRADGPIQFL